MWLTIDLKEVVTIRDSLVRKLTFSSLFAALTAVGALISIQSPFSPVPITLQTFFTLTAGVLLGSRYGALSQVVYVLLGVFGLPVFANMTSGFGVLVGPTGGYLFGFILGALVIGIIAGLEEKFPYQSQPPSFRWVQRYRWILLSLEWIGRNRWMLLSLIVGTLVIYSAGVIQLSIVTGMTIVKALVLGVLPFLIGDSLKIVVAIRVVKNVRRYINYP